MNKLQTTSTFTQFINRPSVQKRINEILEKDASVFNTSLIAIVGSNEKLEACDPMSVFNAALLAASMKLPINQNLGFAYIIPYGKQAQFQMGYKGYFQLALRSREYKHINVGDVREGEYVRYDRLKGEYVFDWENDIEKRNTLDIVGYFAYIELESGYNKIVYWTKSETKAHAKKYSKAYAYDLNNNKKASVWSLDFDAMAKKTLLKHAISKWGIMSIELGNAIEKDQATINAEGNVIDHVDNANNGYVEQDHKVVKEIDIAPEETNLKALGL